MLTVLAIILFYILFGVIIAHVIYYYEKLEGRVDDPMSCICFTWPVFVIGYMFILPCRFIRYYYTKILPAKKAIKKECFQEAINLIETLPIDSFDYDGALYIREKEGSPVCKDWLLFHKDGDSWHVSFCYEHFYIPDSIFFRKEIDILKRRFEEFKEYKKIEKLDEIEDVDDFDDFEYFDDFDDSEIPEYKKNAKYRKIANVIRTAQSVEVFYTKTPDK